MPYPKSHEKDTFMPTSGVQVLANRSDYDQVTTEKQFPTSDLAAVVNRIHSGALVLGVIAPSARMACAGVMEKRPRIPIRLSAVFAVLAHAVCLS